MSESAFVIKFSVFVGWTEIILNSICGRRKTLFSIWIMVLLPLNMEEILVKKCRNMVVAIIGTEAVEEDPNPEIEEHEADPGIKIDIEAPETEIEEVDPETEGANPGRDEEGQNPENTEIIKDIILQSQLFHLISQSRFGSQKLMIVFKN